MPLYRSTGGSSSGSSGGAGASRLADLTDVQAPFPSSGQVLVFAGQAAQAGSLYLAWPYGVITITAGVNDEFVLNGQTVTIPAGSYDCSASGNGTVPPGEQALWDAIQDAIASVAPSFTLTLNGYASAMVSSSDDTASLLVSACSAGATLFNWPTPDTAPPGWVWNLFVGAKPPVWKPLSSYNLEAVTGLNGSINNLYGRVSNLENASSSGSTAGSVGSGNTVFAEGASARGTAAYANTPGMDAFASGDWTDVTGHRPQIERFVLRATTTDATPVALGGGPNGGGQIPVSGVVHLTGIVIGRQQSGNALINGTEWVARFEVLVNADSGAVYHNEFTPIPLTGYTGPPAGVGVAFQQNGFLGLVATGQAGQPWKWMAKVEATRL